MPDADVVRMFPCVLWKWQLPEHVNQRLISTVTAMLDLLRSADLPTLLLFPAWLRHSVPANGNDSERISVSFNLMFADYAEQLAKPLW